MKWADKSVTDKDWRGVTANRKGVMVKEFDQFK